jgi:hypothetical protein
MKFSFILPVTDCLAANSRANDKLPSRPEVSMGGETLHPGVFSYLHLRMMQSARSELPEAD